jgi:tRNA uridine 5-carboxymethylaminomethyl modification enzyme
MRLTDIGRRVGLIGDERYAAFEEKRRAIADEVERMNKTNIAPTKEVNDLLRSMGSTEIITGIKLSELVKRPELTYEALESIDKTRPVLSKGVRITAEIDVKYEGYIKRQLAEVERGAKLEAKRIPDDINYFEIGGLRIEAAEKLSEIRPASIGQASRISGVNPADISVLLIRLGSK